MNIYSHIHTKETSQNGWPVISQFNQRLYAAHIFYIWAAYMPIYIRFFPFVFLCHFKGYIKWFSLLLPFSPWTRLWGLLERIPADIGRRQVIFFPKTFNLVCFSDKIIGINKMFMPTNEFSIYLKTY